MLNGYRCQLDVAKKKTAFLKEFVQIIELFYGLPSCVGLNIKPGRMAEAFVIGKYLPVEHKFMLISSFQTTEICLFHSHTVSYTFLIPFLFRFERPRLQIWRKQF